MKRVDNKYSNKLDILPFVLEYLKREQGKNFEFSNGIPSKQVVLSDFKRRAVDINGYKWLLSCHWPKDSHLKERVLAQKTLDLMIENQHIAEQILYPSDGNGGEFGFDMHQNIEYV